VSSRQERRSHVHAEVLADGEHVDPRGSDESRLNTYLRWCAANDQHPEPPTQSDPDYPGAEQVLRRYLHAHYPDWSWNHVQGQVRVVVQWLRGRGHDNPRGDQLGAYLRTLRAGLGVRKVARTDALTKEQVSSAPGRAAAALHPLSPMAVRLRGVVAVADAFGVDPTRGRGSLQRLPRDAFRRVGDDSLHITIAGETRLLVADRQPEMYAALVDALVLAGDDDQPLAPRLDEAPDRANRRSTTDVRHDNQALFLAWARAFPVASRAEGREHLPRAELRVQIANSGSADRVWWLANLDEWLWMRRRDVAYTLAGVINARRHVELERLTLGDLESTATGYSYKISKHKGNMVAARRGGAQETITRAVDHLHDDPATCPAFCPACAMRDHLEVRHGGDAGDRDPLFVNVNGAAFGIQGARDAIRRLAELVEDLDDNPDGTPRVVGTRTLRVTGATLAYRAGMPAQEIADEVTGHRSADMALLYVRRHDPFSSDLVLFLDGSGRPSRTA
jgi:integrase